MIRVKRADGSEDGEFENEVTIPDVAKNWDFSHLNILKPSANGSTSFPRPQSAWKQKCIHRRNMKLNKNIELNNTTGAIEDAGGTEVSHIVLWQLAGFGAEEVVHRHPRSRSRSRRARIWVVGRTGVRSRRRPLLQTACLFDCYNVIYIKNDYTEKINQYTNYDQS